MTALTQEMFDQTMQQHARWLESGGVDGRRANLSGHDLRGLNLQHAVFSGANLRAVNLADVNLKGLSLAGADLSEANLEGATIAGLDCRGAVLTRANLTRLNAQGAALVEANLTSAQMKNADFKGADCSAAVMREMLAEGADFSNANLTQANLREAKLNNAVLVGATIAQMECRGTDFTGVLLRGLPLDEMRDLDMGYITASQAMERAALEKDHAALAAETEAYTEAKRQKEAALEAKQRKVDAQQLAVEAMLTRDRRLAEQHASYSSLCRMLAISWFIIASVLGTFSAYLIMQNQAQISGFLLILAGAGALLVLGVHLLAAISAYQHYTLIAKALEANEADEPQAKGAANAQEIQLKEVAVSQPAPQAPAQAPSVASPSSTPTDQGVVASSF